MEKPISSFKNYKTIIEFAQETNGKIKTTDCGTQAIEYKDNFCMGIYEIDTKEDLINRLEIIKKHINLNDNC